MYLHTAFSIKLTIYNIIKNANGCSNQNFGNLQQKQKVKFKTRLSDQKIKMLLFRQNYAYYFKWERKVKRKKKEKGPTSYFPIFLHSMSEKGEIFAYGAKNQRQFYEK